jgi:hypothetical protein
MGTATVPLCQHWMDNATHCGSPAMRGTRYCYSHQLAQARCARKNAERARQRWFESAPLQDAASVQRALMQVMTRLLSGNIGHKRAGQILYALQTATVKLSTAGLGPEKQMTNRKGVAKTAQIERNRCATLHVMTTQTIPEYLEEERQKAADTQLRTEEEAARIQPLQHGHHRTAKQPKVELLPPVKAAAKKKKKKKTVAVARKKPRAARKKPRASEKMAAKTRKRA